LVELGPEFTSVFVRQLLLACVEQKKDAIIKTWDMVCEIRADYITDLSLKIGYVNAFLTSSACNFLSECLEEALFSEFPLAIYLAGIVFGDLLADNIVTISDVEILVAEKLGRVPESAKIMATCAVRMKDKMGADKTADFFKGFAWKRLWESGVVDEEVLVEWTNKYGLAFIVEASNATPSTSSKKNKQSARRAKAAAEEAKQDEEDFGASVVIPVSVRKLAGKHGKKAKKYAL
jgi:hypothetical protein